MSDGTRARVKFDYVKSNFFRVIRADGAHGGIAPRGDIFMALYSERPAIPKQVVHELKASSELGDEIRAERTVRDAIIREVEVGVILDEVVAQALVTWLQGKLQTKRQLREDKKEKTRKKNVMRPA